MASDSSPSDTPMVLTPDSTGSTSLSTSSIPFPGTSKKTRRQTAFYPNVNSSNKPQKPFSRSAAKRESVMALGSIEHLQHYFTKTGIAAKKNPLVNKPHHGLVPAIGGMARIRTNSSLGSVAELELPPSPVIPQPLRPAFPPVAKTYEIDPESLLPGVVEDLIAVAAAWGLDGHYHPHNGSTTIAIPTDTTSTSPPPPNVTLLAPDTYTHPTKGNFDVLAVLKATTRAVRSIRNYLVSLPDESAGTIRANFRPTTLGPDFVKRAAKKGSSPGSTSPDPLSLIRRSALEVLTILRELEELCRLPLSDEAYDAQSDGGGSRGIGGGGHSRMASPVGGLDDLPDDHDHSTDPDTSSSVGVVHEMDPDISMTFSLVRVQGREESVPVWEEEEDIFAIQEDEEKEKRERWDERLVLGSGWLYRQDVLLEELEAERRVVGSYLDVVDAVLFGGTNEKEGQEGGGEKVRGWERERERRRRLVKSSSMKNLKARRVSTGDGEGKGSSSGGLLAVDDKGAKRRVSTGMLDMMMNSITVSDDPHEMGNIEEEDGEGYNSVDDEDLPLWAKRNAFSNDGLGRAHAIIQNFLPPYLLAALAPPTNRSVFLDGLSSGQLLCVAYNSCVRKSRKPWGYVSKDGIHDILALERAEREEAGGDEEGGKPKKGWTFRRTDNLRLWAGALKLRYLLPLQVPSQTLAPAHGSGQASPGSANTPLGSPSVTTQRFAVTDTPILFDARVVAKKEEGWEDMLEAVLLSWVAKVLEEKRSGR